MDATLMPLEVGEMSGWLSNWVLMGDGVLSVATEDWYPEGGVD
jgi:hypothetical protein